MPQGCPCGVQVELLTDTGSERVLADLSIGDRIIGKAGDGRKPRLSGKSRIRLIVQAVIYTRFDREIRHQILLPSAMDRWAICYNATVAEE